jgi:parallel beta-helix repeat protein
LIVANPLSTPVSEAASVIGPAAVSPPILIVGDSNFTAANGVVGGTGTAADPYRIEGWQINATGTYHGGIELRNTRSHVIIRNVTVFGGDPLLLFQSGGVYLFNASHVRVVNATVHDNGNGMTIDQSRDISISASNLTRNIFGVYVGRSTNVSVMGTAFRAGYQTPFWVTGSSDVVFQGNRLDYGGIRITSSTRVSVIGNGEIPSGIGLSGQTAVDVGSHTITPDNLVGGKPIRYYAGLNGLTVNAVSAGQVVVANCTNVRMSNLTMSGSFAQAVALTFVKRAEVSDSSIRQNAGGIEVVASANVSVRGNNVSENGFGIAFTNVLDGVVATNEAIGNWLRGISVRTSPAVTIRGNHVIGSASFPPVSQTVGIDAFDSSNATIADNNVSLVRWGIQVGYSDRPHLSGNVLRSGDGGISLIGVTNATVRANIFHDNGLVVDAVYSVLPLYFKHTVTDDNLVNGRPLRYYHDCAGLSLDGIVAGQVIIANCTDIRVAHLVINSTIAGLSLTLVSRAIVTGNEFSYNLNGISVQSSSDLTILDNRLANNRASGIKLWVAHSVALTANQILFNRFAGIADLGSRQVTLTRNVIANNTEGIEFRATQNATVVGNEISRNLLGIYLVFAKNSTIYHNNFVNNTRHALEDAVTNSTWDSGYPAGGNYWSNYAGPDSCSGPNQTVCTGPDGIGDTPVPIPSSRGPSVSRDRYPLLRPYIWPASSSPDFVLILIVVAGVASALAAVVALWRIRRRPPTENLQTDRTRPPENP